MRVRWHIPRTRRANRKPELQCEAVSWSGERGTFTSFYHIYNDTKITKHSVLQDTIRDRQTYEVTFPVREEYAASWEAQGGVTSPRYS